MFRVVCVWAITETTRWIVEGSAATAGLIAGVDAGMFDAVAECIAGPDEMVSGMAASELVQRQGDFGDRAMQPAKADPIARLIPIKRHRPHELAGSEPRVVEIA